MRARGAVIDIFDSTEADDDQVHVLHDVWINGQSTHIPLDAEPIEVILDSNGLTTVRLTVVAARVRTWFKGESPFNDEPTPIFDALAAQVAA